MIVTTIVSFRFYIQTEKGRLWWDSFRLKVPLLGDAAARRIQFVTIPGLDISSTDIRRRVREGQSIRFMTPRAVECYLQEHRIYAAE